MELFLTMKLYSRQNEFFEIELFWHLTECKQNPYLTVLFELEMFDHTE